MGKKSVIALALILVLGNGANVNAEKVKDISDENSTKIEYLLKENIINGYDDGDLKLNNKISRAEIVKLIVTSKKQDDLEKEFRNKGSKFKDISKEFWANGYINVVTDVLNKENSEILTGYIDGSFKPNNNITFEELSKILYLSFVDDNIKIENGNLVKNNNELKSELEKKTKKQEELTKENQDLNSIIEKNNATYEELRKASEGFKDSLDKKEIELSNRDKELESLKSELEAKENVLSKKDEKIKELELNVVNKDKENGLLRDSILKIEQDNQNILSSKEKIHDELNALKKQLQIEKIKNKEITDELNNTLSIYGDLHSKSEELRVKYNIQKDDLKEIKIKLNEIGKDKENLQSVVDSLNKEIADNKNNANISNSDYEILINKIEDKENQINAKQQEIDLLRKNCNGSNGNELREKDEKITELQNIIERLELELGNLKESSNDFNDKENEQSSEDDLIKRLNEINKDCMKDYPDRQRYLEEIENDLIDLLTNKYEEYRKEDIDNIIRDRFNLIIQKYQSNDEFKLNSIDELYRELGM